MVALLSCFVFQEKTDVEPVIPPRLQEGLTAIAVITDRVERIQDRHKVAAEGFRSTLKTGLVEVVYEWAKGMVSTISVLPTPCLTSFGKPFDQITLLTDVLEGTIVRVITRLDETCREVRDAARVIGDTELFKKMEEAQTKIKRDSTLVPTLRPALVDDHLSSRVRCKLVFLVFFSRHDSSSLSKVREVTCPKCEQHSNSW